MIIRWVSQTFNVRLIKLCFETLHRLAIGKQQQNNERQRNKQKDKNKKAKEDSKNNVS